VNERVRSEAIALYDRYAHEGVDRRAFMSELTKLAGSAAAANALLLGIAADPAAAAIIDPGDKRIRSRNMSWRTFGTRQMKGYVAEPARGRNNLGSVLVIHENRGLNDHIRDVARRIATSGYRALAPDFLAPSGGTPTDQDAARAAIGKLDLAQSVGDAVATLGMLSALPRANGMTGAVGFCWGGGMVNRIAVAAGDRLSAGVSFYGPAPDPSLAPRVQAQMLLHLAELDERVNKTAIPWAEALKAAGKQVEWEIYRGVDHAFHNDTSSDRYNKRAAERAWAKTLEFLRAPVAGVLAQSG
jgi:carboxymethylenebutenolidase